DLRTALQAIGDPSRHPLQGIEQTRWNPAWTQEFTRLAKNLKALVEDLRICADAFGEIIGFQGGSFDHADIPHLAAFGALLTPPEAADGILLLGAEAGDRLRTLRACAELANRAKLKAGELGADYDIKVTRLDLTELQREWTQACASNVLVRSARQKKVRLALAPYCQDGVPQDIGRDLVVLQDLAELLGEIHALRPRFVGMERLFEGEGTDSARVEALAAWAEQMRATIHDFGARNGNQEQIRDHAIMLVTEYSDLFGPSGDARGANFALKNALTSTRALAVELGACMNLDDPARLLDMQPGWIEEFTQRIDRWLANLSKAPQWTRWRLAASNGRGAGLGPLVEAIEAGSVVGDAIAPVFEYAYAKWNADEIVNRDEALSAFLAEQHEATIAAFAAADARVAELSKQIVRARIGGGVPSTTNFGKDPEWGTLSHEVNRRARHLPLRQLFGKIPTVLTKLAPCVMMSPLSIAQYLPADAKPFDVVIFDEASQIQVWDAIGAIARGRQVVIVGDPEQLPPTSVGQRTDMEEDDGATVQSQQSILVECLASNLPSLRLNWHYRSRHESLIAFSNAKYYRGELVTVPSPFTSDTAVRFVPVPGGVYERGKAKVNRKEAEAVVDEVVRRMKSSTDSIGVVTFNAEQQKLIENLLDQKRASDPSLERHFDKAQTPEPILVKNIENVQGDERDVIVFSVAVGPDQTGRVTAQISSLNGEGGHRRLNVAITRARREMLVFSTLQPEQIDLGRTNARGVVDFKHFLEFAKNGPRAIAEAFAATGRDTESPFEEAVKRALE
ncbi:MAG TPA: DEAD/DEAH box helicase, partial [Beijerinckiaceae bacterium]|nr:DEAD/DEAH box helicase [Beijerinckiaceae bacterium]